MTYSQVKSHDVAHAEAWWAKVPPLQANWLNSVIATADVDSSTGTLHVKGYAVGGPSGPVGRVQVSIDEGCSWTEAKKVYQEGKWSWTLWESAISRGPIGAHPSKVVYSRAVDVNGNVQPAGMDWNLRGVGYAAFGETQY